ncbi:hypothetical protein ACEWY4_026403 [Coilia grayii]|uniref:G-protein coupled receptors family 1 profile domain-containing protein n=1 Tax=Coilia grayii TaxID=363190 RepID=A0ABD1IUS2_9TELE
MYNFNAVVFPQNISPIDLSETMYASSSISNITNTTDYNFDYFCTYKPVGNLVWGAVCMLCAVIGLPASIWLLWGLWKKGCAGMSKDVYMLNLTFMDLIFNIFNIPGVLNYFVWRDTEVANTVDVLYWFNLSGRPLFMACICVDCYIAVVHPIPYMRMKHKRYRLVACASVWSFTLIYGLWFVLGAQRRPLSFLVFPYVLSLPVIAFCDVAIVRALRRPDPSGRTDVHPQKQRALQTITNSLVMTLVSYLPPLVVFGFSPLMPLSIQSMWCNVIAPVLIAPLLGSTLLPLLYLQNLGYLKRCRNYGCV